MSYLLRTYLANTPELITEDAHARLAGGHQFDLIVDCVQREVFAGGEWRTVGPRQFESLENLGRAFGNWLTAGQIAPGTESKDTVRTVYQTIFRLKKKLRIWDSKIANCIHYAGKSPSSTEEAKWQFRPHRSARWAVVWEAPNAKADARRASLVEATPVVRRVTFSTDLDVDLYFVNRGEVADTLVEAEVVARGYRWAAWDPAETLAVAAQVPMLGPIVATDLEHHRSPGSVSLPARGTVRATIRFTKSEFRDDGPSRIILQLCEHRLVVPIVLKDGSGLPL